MSATIIGAQRIRAQATANTNPEPMALQPGELGNSGPTPAEVVPNLIHGAAGHLGSILSGGSHPESPVTTPVHTGLVQATDSLRGKLGGLIPRANGTVAPGPAGTAVSATENARVAAVKATGDVAAGVRQTTSRLRKVLGI